MSRVRTSRVAAIAQVIVVGKSTGGPPPFLTSGVPRRLIAAGVDAALKMELFGPVIAAGK